VRRYHFLPFVTILNISEFICIVILSRFQYVCFPKIFKKYQVLSVGHGVSSWHRISLGKVGDEFRSSQHDIDITRMINILLACVFTHSQIINMYFTLEKNWYITE